MPILQLTVIQAPLNNPLSQQVLEVTSNGTTLGRTFSNAIVLNEPSISKQHASIHNEYGDYYLFDHSKNGTLVNSRLVMPEQKMLLQEGDLIEIGSFQLKVSLQPESDFTKAQNNLSTPELEPIPPVSDDSLFDKFLVAPQEKNESHSGWGVSSFDSEAFIASPVDDAADPLEALGNSVLSEASNPDPILSINDLGQEPFPDSTPIINQYFTPPDIQDGGNDKNSLAAILQDEAPASFSFIPDNWSTDNDKTNPTAPINTIGNDIVGQETDSAYLTKTAHQPKPSSTDQLMESGLEPINHLAKLLGLEQLTPAQKSELPDEIAEVLKEAISRILSLLRSRSAIKNEMRLERTMIQVMENNPLKFALSQKDAIRYLFGEKSGAYLSGREAIQEAFLDLEAHQLSLLNGMHEAYHKMLFQFSPEVLEQELGPTLRSGLIASRKARLWDAYCKHHENLQKDPEHSFNKLFGNNFVKAYEQQIDQIRAKLDDSLKPQ